ncbi:MAG: hypothetical protein QM831_43875 [Kofleriaceae bacterium]
MKKTLLGLVAVHLSIPACTDNTSQTSDTYEGAPRPGDQFSVAWDLTGCIQSLTGETICPKIADSNEVSIVDDPSPVAPQYGFHVLLSWNGGETDQASSVDVWNSLVPNDEVDDAGVRKSTWLTRDESVTDQVVFAGTFSWTTGIGPMSIPLRLTLK